MAKVLIVLTSHKNLGTTGKETGFHLEEFTTPYYALKDAGIEIDLASPQGGKPPFDPGSLAEDESDRPESVKRFLDDRDAQDRLKQTMQLNQVNVVQYDAVYLPGGHGCMWDLPQSQALADILGFLYDHGKIIAAVCHGPAGFVHAISEKNGEPIVKDKKINSFTDDEEQLVELDHIVPFLLESKLRELGADFQKGGPMDKFVVTDFPFITGQNPKASGELGATLVSWLEQGRKKAVNF